MKLEESLNPEALDRKTEAAPFVVRHGRRQCKVAQA
jgi:hypothetical protein